jgi:hypothetical protein
LSPISTDLSVTSTTTKMHIQMGKRLALSFREAALLSVLKIAGWKKALKY